MKYWFYLFFLACLVLCFFAGQQYFRSKKLLENGIRTNARVIRMITVSDSDGDTYRPVFEYLDQNKTKRVFESSMSTNPPAYAVGDLIEVVYNPEKPDDVKIVSFVGLYMLSLILFITGLSLLIPAFVFRSKWKQKQKNSFYDQYQNNNGI